MIRNKLEKREFVLHLNMTRAHNNTKDRLMLKMSITNFYLLQIRNIKSMFYMIIDILDILQ